MGQNLYGRKDVFRTAPKSCAVQQAAQAIVDGINNSLWNRPLLWAGIAPTVGEQAEILEIYEAVIVRIAVQIRSGLKPALSFQIQVY